VGEAVAATNALLWATWADLWLGLQVLTLSGMLFGALAVVVKGEEAFRAGMRAAKEVRTNLSLYAVDAIVVGPLLALLVQWIRAGVGNVDLTRVVPGLWDALGGPLTLLSALVLQDFVSYWRHRAEHTRLFWPAHAVHHSDTEMMWLTLTRFHPVNRLTTTVIDVLCLSLLGFPTWALVTAHMLAHYYGEFIHADVPWTLGPLRFILVSPAMHRWHHARDVVGAGSNFATVFSVFDRTFGTLHAPGPCRVPLGVTDRMGEGARAQLTYPFRVWSARMRRAWRGRRVQAVRGVQAVPALPVRRAAPE
jgi:sterol desaturase/sphingolipid hydroxylase (fatty acid hydroxylase superfamily)